MNQRGIAELFGVSVQNISYHIGRIIETGELSQDAVIKEILITAHSGARGLSDEKIRFYNLDMIIAVGYRVNSKRATAFRIWATKVLRDYMVKGFALDDERMKRADNISHFRELLERIREIRISERLFYQQIKDIYALSEDYDPSDEMTIAFFKKVQNKLVGSKQTNGSGIGLLSCKRKITAYGADFNAGCRYCEILRYSCRQELPA